MLNTEINISKDLLDTFDDSLYNEFSSVIDSKLDREIMSELLALVSEAETELHATIRVMLYYEGRNNA